jgi:hypothetical protein
MNDERFRALQLVIAERCAFRQHDGPDHAARDELLAMLRREAIDATPSQREELERSVRRASGA